MQPTWLWWSTGKDSAWTLHVLEQSDAYDVTGLVTTVTEPFSRVSMHGTRVALLHEQARSAGLPLHIIRLPYPCSNDAYEAAVAPLLDDAVREGVACMAFGDIHLQDVRAYREDLISGTGIEAIFPIWGMETDRLTRAMLDAGLQAWITCIDPDALPGAFAGRAYDHAFIASIPDDVDPCGENGEFHTFCWDGPMFASPIPVEVGEIVERDGFVYADIIPK